jgi:hypothetical protein
VGDAGVGKLVLASFASYIAVAARPSGLPIIFGLTVAAVGVVCVYLVVAWLLKPFSAIQRDRINALLRRRLFIW